MTVIEGNVRPTLLRPPEHDENKSLIENVLDVTELKVLGTVSYDSHFLFTYIITIQCVQYLPVPNQFISSIDII
jgi:hypothetical protein